MEQAFGADFSGVKVHTDGQSDQLNQSIQARAFTTGQDIFFRQGQYDPGSKGGQELLAHELTHVVQQNGGAVQRQNQINQKLTQELSTKEPNALTSEDNLYALLDGGIISIPLTVGTILVIVSAAGIIINWKDITGNLTEVTTIAIDWVTDTASDVTSKIIDKLSQGVGIARGVLEKARGAIEGVVSHIFASKKPKRGNDSENQEFEGAVSQIQKIIGRKLNKDERQALHQAITGQGYTFWEIVITGVEMFGTVEDLEKIPKNQVPPGWEW